MPGEGIVSTPPNCSGSTVIEGLLRCDLPVGSREVASSGGEDHQDWPLIGRQTSEKQQIRQADTARLARDKKPKAESRQPRAESLFPHVRTHLANVDRRDLRPR